MKNRILFIEDEAGLRVTLGDRLRSEGYAVETAAEGLEGYRKATESGYDLMILDLMLPGKNGLDICRDLRQEGIVTPILILTARTETVDKVLGLKLGADDYVTKPFQTDELLARIESSLRRAGMKPRTQSNSYSFGPFRLDMRRAELLENDVPISVSAKEFQLLRYFVENRGEPVSRDELLTEVWGYNYISSSRTVDVHVAWLRQKLETNVRQPKWIVTVRGLGYKFTG